MVTAAAFSVPAPAHPTDSPTGHTLVHSISPSPDRFGFQNIGKDTTVDDIIDEEHRERVVTKLHEVLRPFLLRRLKRVGACLGCVSSRVSSDLCGCGCGVYLRRNSGPCP